MSMILMGVIALWNIHPKEWLKERWWLVGASWVALYALSSFWSEDSGYWSSRVEVKLPILLLPLAFAFIPSFTIKQLKRLTFFIAICLLAGSIYSIWHLLASADFAEQYRYSKVLPTIAHNDHIRYSLFVTLFIIWSLTIWSYYTTLQKWFIVSVIILLTAFLHVLAVRTGLLGLYIFFFVGALHIIFNKNRVVGGALILLIMLSGIIGYKYVPTLRNKVDYVVYSYKMLQTGNHTGNYSDIGRLLSYDIALKKSKDNMLLGVGVGDMMDEMNDGYEQWYPYVEQQYRLIPHNQFLTVLLGTGVVGLLLFSVWIFMPLGLLRRKGSFFLLATWLVLLPMLLVEPALEVQIGVFVFLIFLLLQRHLLLKGVSLEKVYD
ncbi:MAG: O-antigen ligase family protein [Flavipsychrobacter sp.]